MKTTVDYLVLETSLNTWKVPATLVIPSPEVPSTVGTVASGGSALAARVAEFVDSVAEMASESTPVSVPVAEIRADVEDLRRDFEGTLKRLTRDDERTHRAEG